MSAPITHVDASVSWFRALRYTPMSDLVRGRLSGRLDIDAQLSRRSLPPALRAAVRDTARRAKLWPGEQAELVNELADHFEDGLAAGAPESELIASFGDARQASRMIRRAKLRQRPVAWQALRVLTGVVGLFGAAMIAMYLLLIVRLALISPNVARNYTAELAAEVDRIPAADRAWPLYREAALRTTKLKRGDLRAITMSDPNWPKVEAFIAENQGALELYRQAAQRPELGAPIGFEPDIELMFRHDAAQLAQERARPAAEPEQNPFVIGVLLPHLSGFREGAAMLGQDARIAARLGEGDRALADVVAILRMADHLSGSPFLISDLVSLALTMSGCEVIVDLLATRADLWTDAELAEISHRVAAVRGGGRFTLAFESERVFFADLVQRIYSDDGHGGGVLTAEGLNLLGSISSDSLMNYSSDESWHRFGSRLAAPLFSALVADRATMQRRYDEMMALVAEESARPLWLRTASVADAKVDELQRSRLDYLRFLPLALLFPSLSRASAQAELCTQQRDATLVVLAAELYRRRNGDWPAGVDQLSPRYLPAVPVDRYDGRPIRYRVVDGRPVIYSIGVDRDDDGGRPPSGKGGNARARTWSSPSAVNAILSHPGIEDIDGDWLFFPPHP